MKRIQLLIFAVLLGYYSMASDTIKINNGLGFSMSYNPSFNALKILSNEETDKTYWSYPSLQRTLEVGVQYKSLGIKYKFALSGKYEVPATNKATDLMMYYYSKRFGAEIYHKHYKGYLVPHETDGVISPWNLDEIGYENISDMYSKGQVLNLYGRIIGRHQLSDYFCSPLENRDEVKLGIYGLFSLRRKKIDETSNFFFGERSIPFEDISDGFISSQLKTSVGIGGTGTAFWGKKIYVSASVAGVVSLIHMNNTVNSGEINEDVYKENYFKGEVLNFKVFAGYWGKALQMEFGNVMEKDYGNINSDFYFEDVTSYYYWKIGIILNNKISFLDKWIH